MIAPGLSELAHERAGALKVVKVDVDANPGLARTYGAMSIPLLVVFRDGAEVDRVVGALPRAELEQRLKAGLVGGGAPPHRPSRDECVPISRDSVLTMTMS